MELWLLGLSGELFPLINFIGDPEDAVINAVATNWWHDYDAGEDSLFSARSHFGVASHLYDIIYCV